MKNYLVLFLTLTLIACGPSQDEKEKIAAVSCAVMSETRNMDAAIRVREMNAAREKIGGEPFLRGDDAIKEAFEYGLCEELVLDAAIYDESLGFLKDAERERKRIAAEERAERERIAAEEQIIADSKPRVEEEFHPNGELKGRTNYKSKDDGGKRHGLNRTWHENGQLRGETTYKDGEVHGLERLWHNNGQLRRETTYKDGNPQGLIRTWYNNGQLRQENSWKNGKPHGLTRVWRENGKLDYELCFVNGRSTHLHNCQD